MFVQLVKLYDDPKKYKMIFYDDDRKKVKTTKFGASGMSDYTIHKDKERRQRYLDRHRKNERWDKPMTAGSLSRKVITEKRKEKVNCPICNSLIRKGNLLRHQKSKKCLNA
jgi:hypothetical protein